MNVLEKNISFSVDEVVQFGKLTGDDGPIHSIKHYVQGGLIVSTLPKWLREVLQEKKLLNTEFAFVTLIIDARFRNKLPSNTDVMLQFTYDKFGKMSTKMNWKIYSDDIEYCHGSWILFKADKITDLYD